MSSLSAKRRFFEEAEGEGEEGEGGTEGAGDQQQHQRRPHQYSSSALKRAKLDLGVSTKPAEEVLISQQQPLATIGFGSCLVSPVLLHVPQTTPFGLSTGNTPSTSSTNTPITFIPTSSSSVLNSTQNKVFHIQKMLPTLDKPQLLAILNHLLTPPQASNTTSSTTTSNANTQHHQQLHLEITQTLASAIPPPTLANIHSLLQSLSLNFQQAFPYSRNGVDYSDYTFNRVKPALTELLDAVCFYLNYFTDPANYSDRDHEYPADAMGYLDLTTHLVHRLPTWTSPRHTHSTKYEMYTRLAQVYRYVLTQIGERVHKHGKVFPGGVVGEWAEAVKSHVMHLQQQQQQGGAGPGFGFDGDLVDVFRRQLGWLAESVNFGHFTTTHTTASYLSPSTPVLNHHHSQFSHHHQNSLSPSFHVQT